MSKQTETWLEHERFSHTTRSNITLEIVILANSTKNKFKGRILCVDSKDQSINPETRESFFSEDARSDSSILANEIFPNGKEMATESQAKKKNDRIPDVQC